MAYTLAMQRSTLKSIGVTIIGLAIMPVTMPLAMCWLAVTLIVELIKLLLGPT